MGGVGWPEHELLICRMVKEGGTHYIAATFSNKGRKNGLSKVAVLAYHTDFCSVSHVQSSRGEEA